MPTRSRDNQLQNLKAEIEHLRADNERLRQQVAAAARPAVKKRTFSWKALGSSLCIVVAALLLALGNLLFWAGNTVVKPEDYAGATAPIIKDPEVQSGLAQYTTEQVFRNIDVTQIAQDALPPRADFLAPSIAAQLQTYTNNTLASILARPEFQQRWNNAQQRIHERFITVVNTAGSDGTIDIGEIYAQVTQNLAGTKLAFLADKPLPPRIGTIQIANGAWIAPLQAMIQYIDIWRVLVILLFVGFAALGVWLSVHRRRTVVLLSLVSALFLFLSLIAGRVVREVVASTVAPPYAEAVRSAYSIFMQGFVVQTYVALAVMVVVALVAWVSSNSGSSRAFKQKLDQLLSGRIHSALFGSGENAVTLWVGAHRVLLEWLAVLIIAAVALFVRVTPTVLIVQVIGIVLVVLVIEIIAARPARSAAGKVSR